MTYPLQSDARVHSSNLPASMEPPDGVMLGDLTGEQRIAVHGLLSASMSSQGYAKVAGVIRSDDLLHETSMARFAAAPATDDEKFLAALARSLSPECSGNRSIASQSPPAWRSR